MKPNFILFLRTFLYDLDSYLLKVLSQALAFSCCLLVILFSLEEMGYDRFYKDYNKLFRVIQKNTTAEYEYNRLKSHISPDAFQYLKSNENRSSLLSRVKTLNNVNLLSGNTRLIDQRLFAVDSAFIDIISLDPLNGSLKDFSSSGNKALLSTHYAKQLFGRVDVSGVKFNMYTYDDTLTYTVAAVFNEFPNNGHVKFDALIGFNSTSIRTLDFNPNEFGVYGKAMSSSNNATVKFSNDTDLLRQSIADIYFGPRTLGEDSLHGDWYSIMILIFITSLIFILALITLINLTTLTIPHRAKELAIKKLSGSKAAQLTLHSFKESLSVGLISLVVAIGILFFAAPFINETLQVSPGNILMKYPWASMFIVITLVTIFSAGPLIVTQKFIRASPIRLLSAKAITFPKLKNAVMFTQLSLSMLLIVLSVVTRRQINFSLLKEPGQNHDQIVYIEYPNDLSYRNLLDLRANWSNPHIIDLIGTSQLPNNVNSKTSDGTIYTMSVDRGFKNFFQLDMLNGNWFQVNDGDSVAVVNEMASTRMASHPGKTVKGVFQNMGALFNQPDKPISVTVSDVNFNFLCLRIFEVDIRQTVDFLSDYFSKNGKPAKVTFLNPAFEQWLNYQDRLNKLSVALSIISLLLSGAAIFGLSISIVRDKLKDIAIHRLCGAGIFRIGGLLAKKFVLQVIIVSAVMTPIIYFAVTEFLNQFIYRTHLELFDLLLPIAYNVGMILVLCCVQALVVTKIELVRPLKS